MSLPAVSVSFVPADRSVGTEIVAELSRYGLDVWCDDNVLRDGRLQIDEVEEQLRRRDVLIVLLSTASERSAWQKMIVGAFCSLIAQGEHKTLLPVRLDEGRAVPLLLQGTPWIDASDRKARDIARLVAQALGITEVSPTELTAKETTQSHDDGAVRASDPPHRQPPSPSRRGTQVFAIANQKGQTGKTTTAVNLAAYLAEAGHRTLLVDMCPDADATTHLGVDAHRVGGSIYELLVNDDVAADDAIKPNLNPNLSLLPAKVDLYAADIEFTYLDQREYRLQRALEAVKPQYDFILIDCPSSLGWLTVNALTAADGVILPLQCEYFALEGMQQLLNTIRLVRDRLNPRIHLFGVVLTMYDPRTKLGTEVVREISEHFPRERFQTVIPRNVRLAEAPSFGQTILEHDPRSPGALAYKDLAEEVIARAAAIKASSA